MILGIVGGLSPEVTAEFYLKIVEQSRHFMDRYPHIIIDSIPLDSALEREIIVNSKDETRLLPFLLESVRRLQNTDLIVIPCNTAHIFIEDLRKESSVPILSIVEETAHFLKTSGHKKCGLIATTSTVKSDIYRDESVEFFQPTAEEQLDISRTILKSIRNELTETDKANIRIIAEKMLRNYGCVVLGCTDMRFIVQGHYVDSFEILADAVFDRIMEGS